MIISVWFLQCHQNWRLEEVEKENTAGKLVTCFEKLAYRLMVNIYLPHTPLLPLLGISPKEVTKGTGTCSSIIHSRQKGETTQVSISA